MPSPSEFEDRAGMEEPPPLMPVRRLHNYLYCPRLFYLQWVEGVFVPNEDTVEGSALHKRVDQADKLKYDALCSEGGSVRSLTLESQTLGICGVIDLLESLPNGSVRVVDYKKGHPWRNEAGEWQVKENDAVQLAAYALLLAEVGIHASSGSVYYAAIKRHVPVEFTAALFDKFHRTKAEALAVAENGVCPAPVPAYERCLACSAYPVCLPMESRRWAGESVVEGDTDNEREMRPPMPAGAGGEILIVQNPKAYISLKGGELVVSVDGAVVIKHPLHQLHSVSLFGAIQMSTNALQALMELGVPVAYFSPAGRFIGMSHGLPSSGVDARIGQCRMWAIPEKRLTIASEIIRSKIHNQRVMLMRNGKASEEDLRRMARLRDDALRQTGLAALRGVEGEAASLYFSNFATMLRDGGVFDFKGRNRRPPKDAVNALLSMAYSTLSKELTGMAYTAGLDPFLGFFHSPRYGRPALALDMMEEFRPLVADSVVVTMLNRREVTPEDFLYTSRGVMLKDSGRRQFWRAWTRRMDTEVSHPTFGYRMSYRRMMMVQMQQFWRFCKGETSAFHGFTTR